MRKSAWRIQAGRSTQYHFGEQPQGRIRTYSHVGHVGRNIFHSTSGMVFAHQVNC